MRIRSIRAIFIGILVLISLRLFYWQVIQFDTLSSKAEEQHLSSLSVDAPRGRILAIDGGILVSDKPTFTLFAQPNLIKEKDSTALNLAKAFINLGLTGQEAAGPENTNKTAKEILSELKLSLSKTLSQELVWVPLKKNLDLNTRKKIEGLNLTGVGFDNGLSRYYPESSSAAHLLGFTGSDSMGKRVGYFGVEGFYNGELKGVGGKLLEEKDAQGQPILIGRFFKKEPKVGHNIILNLDRTVQYIIDKKLKEGVTKYGAKSGTIIVIEPFTGAVVAMSSYPAYDPNNFEVFPKDIFRNPAVADTYEPGSTFKVLVMAAALNEGLIKPETTCDICSGPVKIADYSIKTWNNKYYPDSSMSAVIVHSDNTGMVFIGKKLGLDKMYKYVNDYGFGNLTGIDLQDETTADIRPEKDWREIDLATATFGQGIAVTPIQMVRAVSAIANGGLIMEPKVAQAIDINGHLNNINPKEIRRVVSPEAADMVKEMMVLAVKQGEARVFAPKGFKIAGKTGTAQIPVAGHYDANKTIASFVGFAPADRPKFVMLVLYREPSSSTFGSETAAPTFFEIAKELLTYYNIGPEE